jgi:hypothetical protein
MKPCKHCQETLRRGLDEPVQHALVLVSDDFLGDTVILVLCFFYSSTTLIQFNCLNGYPDRNYFIRKPRKMVEGWTAILLGNQPHKNKN